MRALNRLIPGRQRPGNGEAVVGDERAAAAATALRSWSSAQAADTTGEQLAYALRMLVAVPVGADREALVRGELRKGLEAHLAPGIVAELLNRHLDALCEAFDSKDLANALAAALGVLTRDGFLAQHLTAVQTAEAASTAESEPTVADAERRCRALAAATQKMSSMATAQQRYEELKRTRSLACQQADELLKKSARDIEERAISAAAQLETLQGDLAVAIATGDEAKRLSALESEGQGFEDELSKLQERREELRAELDRVSQEVETRRAKQQTHMSQVDFFRSDKDGVRSATSKSKTDVEKELETTAKKKSTCEDFAVAVLAARTGLSDACSDLDAESGVLAEQADRNGSDAFGALSEVARAQLSAAIEKVQKAQAEDTRARQHMEMMEVAVTETELPTRRLFIASVQALSRVWTELQQYEGIIPDEKRAEVEQLLGSFGSMCSSTA